MLRRVRSAYCAWERSELVFVKRGVLLQNVGYHTNTAGKDASWLVRLLTSPAPQSLPNFHVPSKLSNHFTPSVTTHKTIIVSPICNVVFVTDAVRFVVQRNDKPARRFGMHKVSNTPVASANGLVIWARSQNRKSGVVSWECAGRAALSLSHSAQSRSQRRATASEAHRRRFGLEP